MLLHTHVCSPPARARFAVAYYHAGPLLLQVFISYGPKSSGDLLLSYGFCPPLGANPHDAFHMVVAADEADPCYSLKHDELIARNIPSQESFALRVNGLPPGLLAYVAFCDAQLTGSTEVSHLARALFDDGVLPVWHGLDTQALALEGVSRRCSTAIQGQSQT